MYDIEHSSRFTLSHEKEAKAMRLDPIDSQIISMLQDDGRRSFSEIAAN
ncbi:MAG: AsnC family transcriptional regulator [Candidatus Thorarchaeota archaeon]